MQIQVIQQESGLNGGREVWIKVMSNSAPTLPDVKQALGDQWRDAGLLPTQQPISYYPHFPTKEERDEHGCTREDWWVFARPVG